MIGADDARRLLDMKDAIDAVEQAFRWFSEGSAQMPVKSYLNFEAHDGDLRVMPAAAGKKYAGVKIVNSHRRNPDKGLPAVMGTYVLVSQESGLPLSILDATYLTAVRTGAASAVATKYMARQEAASVGLVGSGVQATFQLLAISKVREIREVFAWSPEFDRSRRDAFLEETRPMFPEIDLIPADEIEKAAIADIVVTTTPSRGPVLMDSHIGPGTHINAVGADGPGKQELDPAILKRARVIVDELEQAWHGGEINVPLASGELSESDIDGSLDQVVNGDIPGRTSADEVTIFDSTGLATEDIAVAILVYERALKEGAGSEIEL